MTEPDYEWVRSYAQFDLYRPTDAYRKRLKYGRLMREHYTLYYRDTFIESFSEEEPSLSQVHNAIEKWIATQHRRIRNFVEQVQPGCAYQHEMIKQVIQDFDFHVVKGELIFVRDPFVFINEESGKYRVRLMDKYVLNDYVAPSDLGHFEPEHDEDVEGFRMFLKNWIKVFPLDEENQRVENEKRKERVSQVEMALRAWST